jgi:hypothetical protein
MPAPFAIFVVCWIMLGVGSWIFYDKASYEAKKSAHPFIIIGIGAIFAVFVEWTNRWQLSIFVFLIPVIVFLNIRNTQFCPRCNATLHAQGFSRSDFCRKCGAELH